MALALPVPLVAPPALDRGLAQNLPAGTRFGDGRRIAVLTSATLGGAGIAATRFAEALRGRGADVDVIDTDALGGRLPDEVRPNRSFAGRRVGGSLFSVEHVGFCRDEVVARLAAYDAVNVHWAVGLIALAELDALSEAGRPLVFSLHDFQYITGGCHYPGPCRLFLERCAPCPQIDTRAASRAIPPSAQTIKRQIFAKPNVALTAPSAFVRNAAVASGIVPSSRAHLVRNPYCALEPPRLAPGPVVSILLIADILFERRKNMALALKALSILGGDTDRRPPVRLDLVGRADPALRTRLAATGLPAVEHGSVRDPERLTAILRQADIVLTASTDDNWPNILVEAGAYGAIPVVCPGHGCEEFVRTFDFGVVARDYRAASLAEALVTAIDRRSAVRRDEGAHAIRTAHAPGPIADALLAILFGTADGTRPSPS